MISEREREIERICEAALERPRDEREAFLADACAGDDDVRREVERLLAQEGAASRFLEMPALAVAGTMVTSHHALTAGQQIFVVDVVSKSDREVYAVAGEQVGSPRLSKDSRTICFEIGHPKGDIWMATLEDKP